MNRWLVLALIVIAVVVLKEIFGDEDIKSNAKSLQDDYSTWESAGGESFISIGRSLVKNGISGCGEYYVKKSNNTDGEYAVACTSDGRNFKYHLVWVNTQKVVSIEDDGIKKPH